MKSLSIITTILTLFLLSCTSDEDAVLFDFSGTYEGTAACSNVVDGFSSEETAVTIEKTGDLSYTIFFADDITFVATQSGDMLTIDEQTFNEGGQFDVVTLAGTVEKTTNGIQIQSTHTVDDEGITDCTMLMTKQ